MWTGDPSRRVTCEAVSCERESQGLGHVLLSIDIKRQGQAFKVVILKSQCANIYLFDGPVKRFYVRTLKHVPTESRG